MVVVASSDDADDMNDEQWFDGRIEGGPAADAFLGRARQLAPAALDGLVAADDTGAIAYGCLLTVDVPGVQTSEWPVSTHQLQVLASRRWVLTDTGRVVGGRRQPPRNRRDPDRSVRLSTRPNPNQG